MVLSVSKMENLIKAQPNSWSITTLLTLNLFLIITEHASTTLNLQAVNISTNDSKIMLNKSTLIVFFLLKKDIYDYCYYNDSFVMGEKKKFHSQGSILKNIAKNGQFQEDKDFNGAPCMYFDGLFEYFNAHIK